MVDHVCSYNDPQPDYSAFREASYGHATLEIMNKTHAIYHWNRNDEGMSYVADAIVLENQYWLVHYFLENIYIQITYQIQVLITKM